MLALPLIEEHVGVGGLHLALRDLLHPLVGGEEPLVRRLRGRGTLAVGHVVARVDSTQVDDHGAEEVLGRRGLLRRGDGRSSRQRRQPDLSLDRRLPLLLPQPLPESAQSAGLGQILNFMNSDHKTFQLVSIHFH